MKKSLRLFWIVFFSGFGAFLVFILLCVLGAFGKLPSLKELENPSILQSSEVFAADGTLMGKYYTERGNRSSVSYRDISPHVLNALIATEDERFYDHAGIDFKRTFSAILSLGGKGGGSTITQQLAKALLDQGSKNTATRVVEKFKEYIVAIRLERNFTKEEIIALYLNAVPYGDNIYGIRNAARTFFQKEPYELAVDEAALLVGILRGNSIYNPRNNPKEAKERRNVVIGQMEKNEKIGSADAAKYKALPIKINYKKMDENTGYAPYFREVLRNEVKNVLKDLENQEGEEYSVYKDGLKIYTTINPRLQEYAEEAVAQQMPILQKALNNQRNIKNGSVWKDHENVLQAAMKASDRWKAMKDDGLGDRDIKAAFKTKVPMKIFAWNPKHEKDTVMTPMDSIKYHRQMMQTGFIAMDPVTGEVKAWVGGIYFKTYKLDHAQLDVKRQVGSTIKPLLYCQAMEERGMSPETIVQDQQQSFGKGILVPATSKSCKGGSISMASALAWSKNCATAYIMKQVGPAQFANFLERIQIPTKVAPFPSIALGACDLSLFEMLWGYTLFAGGGFSTKPTFISRIEDRNGNVIYRSNFGANRKQVVSEATAYKMAKMMEGPVTKGTAKGLMQDLGVKEMGGKTGTTNDNADAWFMGYTPQLLAGVWVGCDDRFIRIESAQGYGGTAARPIFQAFFKKAINDKSSGLDKQATFQVPADLQNEITNADIMEIIPETDDAAGSNPDMGADDYTLDTTSYGNMKPESEKPVTEAEKPRNEPKKDTAKKGTAIGSAPEEKKEKKGFFKKIFGGKDKEKEEQKANDY
jgi:penicillin-binding protein 1A